MERAVVDLKNLGATVVEIDKEELNDESGRDAYEVLLYEFKHDLNAYLNTCNSNVKVKSLEQLIEYNMAHADKEMPYFEQEIFLAAQDKGDLNSEAYLKALDNVLTSNGPNGIDRVMKKLKI